MMRHVVTILISALLPIVAVAQYGGPPSRILGDLTVGGQFHLSDTVWEDLTLSSLQFRDPPGGEAAPALVPFVNGPVTNYVSDFDTGERAYGILQMSHKYKQNTEVRPHIHWSSSAAVTAQFSCAMSYGPIMGQITNAYYDIITVTNMIAKKQMQSAFTPITDITNKLGESGVFCIALKCENSGGDGQDLVLFDVDIHYQADKLGSDNENPYE